MEELKTLYKDLQERQKYLESIERTEEIKARISENFITTLRVQQLLIPLVVNPKMLSINGRRLFRGYAQSKGKEAKEFVEIKAEWYNEDRLFTKDSKGNLEQTSIDYKEMVNWVIRSKPAESVGFGDNI